MAATIARGSMPRRLLAGVFVTGIFAFALGLDLNPATAQEQVRPGNDDALTDHYTDLWSRGEYHEALRGLDVLIANSNNYVPVRLKRHRAQLLFQIGRVDEAIAEMSDVVQKYPEPSNTLDLALMYEYVGKKDLYDQYLREAARQTRGNAWRYNRREANYVAMGRIAELLGENPRTILTTHFGVLLDRDPRMIEAHLGAGDLAYRQAGYDIAAKHYTNALALDPVNQEALAGLAECYWKSSDGRLEGALDTLFKLNPKHPRGKAIVIEKMLDSAEYRDALNEIDEALAINPVSLRFRSLKAAAYFLADDLEAMERIQQEVLQFNPHCSEAYRTAGRIASRQYLFKEGAALQARALEINPNDAEARALHSLDLLRLGEEEEGRQGLDAAFAANPFHVQMYNMLELMDTLATFEVIERGPFVLKLPKHEAPLVAEDALELLDDAFTRYTLKYDVDIETPVLVEMFDRHDDFMVRSVGLPGSVGHLGICFGRLVTLDSPSARPRGSWNWRSVLWHEFVHVITLQKTKNRMPRWLSEGISVHEEADYSPALKSKMDPDYRVIVNEDGIPGVRDIDAFFNSPPTAGHLMFGYFVAGEFIDFYVAKYGHEPLNIVLDQIAEGAETEDALAKAAGITLRELDEAFVAYQTERYKAFDNLPDPVELAKAAAANTRLTWPPEKLLPGIKDEAGSSPFTDALKRAQAAIEKENWDAAIPALEEAHALFPDHTGADAPLRQLADVYRRMEHDEKRQRTLERILYWSPAELDAAKELVTTYTKQRNWEKVAQTADWAIGIDPYNVELHRSYSDALIKINRGEDALDSLSIVAHLDPSRATDYRLERVEILGTLGRFDEARSEVIRTLEDVPHYWKAQELLLDLVEPAAIDTSPSEAPTPEQSVDEPSVP